MKLTLAAIAIIAISLFSGCAELNAYNRHVSARSVSVEADQAGNYTGTYKVEYWPGK